MSTCMKVMTTQQTYNARIFLARWVKPVQLGNTVRRFRGHDKKRQLAVTR